MADAPTTPEVPFRILPRLTDLNRDFWTGGKVGELRFQRCQQCGYYNHPATPLCPMCHSKALEYEPISGRATLWTYTVNHQAWMPGPELPFIVAIVAFPEQGGLRLTTNLVDVEPEDVKIGMELDVVFENHDDEVWIPLFRPVEGA